MIFEHAESLPVAPNSSKVGLAPATARACVQTQNTTADALDPGVAQRLLSANGRHFAGSAKQVLVPTKIF